MSRRTPVLPEIKTSLKSKIRSRPKVVSAGRYLDLYILNQEKARLEQELHSVSGRMRNLESSLNELRKGIAELEKELIMKAGHSECGKVEEKAPGNQHKAMSIEY